MIRTRPLAAMGLALGLLCYSTPTPAVTINFDAAASGAPLLAPTGFDATSPLSTQYASLGVTFSGPASGEGGAILDAASFGVPARSGINILAFNSNTYARFPETLNFTAPVSSVQIYASGSNDTETFVMNAYNDANVLVDSATIQTRLFAPLNVSYAAGIRRVVLNRTAGVAGFRI
jgi:hypothetical protein